MGLFPTIPGSEPGTPGQNKFDQLRAQFPPGSDEAFATDRTVEMLKRGHAVIRSLLRGNALDKSTFDEAEQELKDFVRTLDPNNPIDAMALGSMILMIASAVPPTAYGEDYSDWEF